MKIYLKHRNKQHSIVQGAARSRAAMMTEMLALDTDTEAEKMCPGVRCWSALRSVPTPAPGTDTCYCHEMSRIGSLNPTCAGGGAALLGGPGALLHVKLPVVEGVGVGGPAPDTGTRVSRGTGHTCITWHGTWDTCSPWDNLWEK